MTTPIQPVDGIAWPVALALRDCVCGQWADVPELAPARCCVVPGRDVAIDDCCAGQAWVRVARVYPTTGDTFPDPQVGGWDVGGWPYSGPPGNCDDQGTWAVQLGVGVARCMPGPDDDGNPPACDDLAAAAAVQADDRARVWNAIMCCLVGKGIVSGLAVGEWLPAGPAGGCGGGEWQLVVLVDPAQPYAGNEAAAGLRRPPTYVD